MLFQTRKVQVVKIDDEPWIDVRRDGDDAVGRPQIIGQNCFHLCFSELPVELP
jgi:hypothetical protein